MSLINLNCRIFFILLFFFPSIVTAQENAGDPSKSIQTLMAEKIRLLKNGALLFRLHTKENSIAALRDAGNQETADKIENQQQEFNKNLIAAFREKYNFSPVYFFTSDYTDTLLSGNISHVVFVNDSLDPDPSIKLTQSGFLIAEAGTLEPDTGVYFEGQYYDYSEKRQKKESYYGSSNMGLDAIRIMNDRFVQLTNPFPYYLRLYTSMPVPRKIEVAVEKLNTEFNKYYKEVSK